jgi:hypothetical protein
VQATLHNKSFWDSLIDGRSSQFIILLIVETSYPTPLDIHISKWTVGVLGLMLNAKKIGSGFSVV